MQPISTNAVALYKSTVAQIFQKKSSFLSRQPELVILNYSHILMEFYLSEGEVNNTSITLQFFSHFDKAV